MCALKKQLRRKEKALAEAATLLVLRKKPMRFGGGRGRLISISDGSKAIKLISEAVGNSEYMPSKFSFYRIMREHKQQHHRGRCKAPAKRPVSTHEAIESNQVWCWDDSNSASGNCNTP